MTARPINKLESQLQSLIEGAFARLFGRVVSARDLAVLLRRTMEENVSQRRAPNCYQIALNPDTAEHFVKQYPDITARFAALILEFSRQCGYQLHASPQVELLPDSRLASHQAVITASHCLDADSQTIAMQPTTGGLPLEQPKNQPALHILNPGKVIPLDKSLINIGRESSNDIVIRDAYISRHHLQLRRRFGAYTLFDVNSRGGTLVNNTAVREHQLQHGDVIYIGHTRLVYADETAPGDDITQALDSL